MGAKDFIRNNMNKMKRDAANKLKSAPTVDQVAALSTAVSSSNKTNNIVRQQIEKNAPKEMRSGVRRIIKEGETPTVDLLLREYRTVPGFKQMAEKVGLSEAWFVDLAEQTMKEEGFSASKTE